MTIDAARTLRAGDTVVTFEGVRLAIDATDRDEDWPAVLTLRGTTHLSVTRVTPEGPAGDSVQYDASQYVVRMLPQAL